MTGTAARASECSLCEILRDLEGYRFYKVQVAVRKVCMQIQGRSLEIAVRLLR